MKEEILSLLNELDYQIQGCEHDSSWGNTYAIEEALCKLKEIEIIINKL